MFRRTNIRPSAIAGTWYPGEAGALQSQMEHFFSSAARLEHQGQLLALVAPHAGYMYSGRCAAHAFKQVAGEQYDRVIIASPLHAPADEPYLTSAYDHYETPLGTIPIDNAGVEALNQALLSAGMPQITPILREKEHSLEIELPFLQYALKGSFELLPLMVRTHNPRILQQLGGAIAELLPQKKTLMVASTDLSHFYPAKTAQVLDQNVLKHIEALEPERLLTENEAGTAQACGAGAVAAILWAAIEAGANQAVILKYTHSGEATGDITSVVGYGAAAIFRKPDA